MKKTFSNDEGSKIVYNLIKVIQSNKQYLSEVDGAIGDGDHGINMNKGFTMCGQELKIKPGNLTYSLEVLSRVLIQDIGGSMGPLYGMFFKAMADTCKNKEIIDGKIYGIMLKASENSVIEIGAAKVGDKTMLDTLIPAVKTFNDSINNEKSFEEAIKDMRAAAIKGKNSTKGMIAKVGRASRLGERSREFIDAGAASCCLILESMADTIVEIIK